MSPRLALAALVGGLAAALLLAPAAPEARTEPHSPPATRAADLELVFKGERGPLRLAVRVEIDGTPLASVWDAALRRLFDHLDRDGDGRLGRGEATRAPSALRLRQLSWGYFAAQQEAPVPWGELAGAPDAPAVTFAAFAAYYRRHGLGTPVLAAGVEPGDGLLTRALLRHLDRDGDGRVSRAEWEAAEAALAPLDLNEDEVISPDELVPDRPYPLVQGTSPLAPAVVGREPGAPFEHFPLLPAGGAVPAAWWAPPPDRELVVRLGKRPGGRAALEWRAADRLLAQALPGELLHLDLGGTRAVLGLGESRVPADFAAFRAAARQRFAEADTNGDGVVDAAEAGRTTFAPLRSQFDRADRDGDGRLTAAEWDAWLDLEGALLAGQVLLSAVDQGRGLFEFLDADRDGRLSRRELRSAWARLAAAGCVGGEAVRLDRLPRQLLAAVGVGPQRLPLVLTRRAGPDWFRAMDRNNDGDVSLREFVGPLERFRAIDADGDGLISPEEADRVKAFRP